ncbi:MAG: hypothetical protein AOA65_0755 [Candidatus Bathyarchaeota archaeon BA1]|nr:MAG: hypothetical protein AOA65_0755 [Candidatus Bathyarchaeota archaeon BA1]
MKDLAIYNILTINGACRETDRGAMKVRFSKRVLNHIVKRHPEVEAHVHKIAETVEYPEVIIRGTRGELKALKFYPALPIGPKYLVVVYREIHEEKVIITAYFTSNLAKIRGEIIWIK